MCKARKNNKKYEEKPEIYKTTNKILHFCISVVIKWTVVQVFFDCFFCDKHASLSANVHITSSIILRITEGWTSLEEEEEEEEVLNKVQKCRPRPDYNIRLFEIRLTATHINQR